MSSSTVGDLLHNTHLERIDIKLLLRHVLGYSEAQLLIRHMEKLSDSQLVQFNHLVSSRQSGVPIHYILGCKEFYSREFKVTSDTLIPRPETELLVEETLKLANHNDRMLDLGTGSGCIAITCKLEMPTLDVVAVDKSSAALCIAKTNAGKLNADVLFLHSDWYENAVGKFNLIVSNPPYIAGHDAHLQALQYEPQQALTDFNDGLDAFRHITAGAPQYLVNGGYLVLEHGFDQAVDIQNLLAAQGFSEITTIKDYSGLNRITQGRNQSLFLSS